MACAIQPRRVLLSGAYGKTDVPTMQNQIKSEIFNPASSQGHMKVRRDTTLLYLKVKIKYVNEVFLNFADF